MDLLSKLFKPATFVSCILCLLEFRTWAADKTPIADLPKHAIEASQITVAGAHPFYLRAKVSEATNLENDEYKAQIEEYWVAPEQWRRIVKAADFSETLIVNGQKVSEQVTGDYYPNWLRTLVNAIFDLRAALQGVDMSKSSDNPMIGGTKFCRRFAYRAGIPPVGNNVFSVYCFENGLLVSVGKPGYGATYKDYKEFAGKLVARKVREYIEPGTEVEASIEELSELKNPDETLFGIQQFGANLETLVVSEATVRSLSLESPTLEWPPIHGGKPSGVLSVYLCIDREGKVRETYALNSDHPEMSDAARKQLLGWRFKPATHNSARVQVESILTFAYTTRIVH